MKKLLLFAAFLPLLAVSQTILPITNNMVITSFSNIKFIPGNYVFSDPGNDGVIQVNNVNNVILDGDGCFVDGTNYSGYCIKINNSHHIVIKNFDSVFKYKYAVYITNSHHIQIYGNNFSHNKVDSSGWIDVWADYTAALGGGVMMWQSRAANIYGNVMKMQNDGVAMYHCDSVEVANNDFAWNTSYGIRMFWTDTCYIHHNVSPHINRPQTDPSDCAAILMIISNKNRVEYNDFSWSGDGIFLGQYQHSNIPNNNYFAYNECSFSPHNAIEATFADGNVYKHNKCNYSWYGFWLGYSFNSIVDSNEVIGNTDSGIAIDRGFSNTITNNIFKDNPKALYLWEGSAIPGYANQYSQDYLISDNLFEGNTAAIDIEGTEHAVILNNDFLYNQSAAIYINGVSPNDTITNNDFRMTTAYHIANYSNNDIYAPSNSWEPNDTRMINDKIYDKADNGAKGQVLYNPPLAGPPPAIQSFPPCDMAEPGTRWYGYPELGYGSPKVKDTVCFDTTEKMVGAASVKMESGRGWYVGLNYRAGDDSVSFWQMMPQDTLYFWVRTIKNPVIGFQYFHIRIGDYKGNYYKYTASTALLNNAHLTWKRYQFPLSGNTQFSRTTVGAMGLDSVSYVEFDADTWDYGYTIWLDGVQFTQCNPTVTGVLPLTDQENAGFVIYPNPVTADATIRFRNSCTGNVSIALVDIRGIVMKTLVDQTYNPGEFGVRFSTVGLPEGVYLVRMVAGDRVTVRKLIIAD